MASWQNGLPACREARFAAQHEKQQVRAHHLHRLEARLLDGQCRRHHADEQLLRAVAHQVGRIGCGRHDAGAHGAAAAGQVVVRARRAVALRLGAQAFEVGRHDREARGDQRRDRADVVADEAVGGEPAVERDRLARRACGRSRRALDPTVVVPCTHATTGQPPTGAVPRGTKSSVLALVICPLAAFIQWIRRRLSAVIGAGAA